MVSSFQYLVNKDDIIMGKRVPSKAKVEFFNNKNELENEKLISHLATSFTSSKTGGQNITPKEASLKKYIYFYAITQTQFKKEIDSYTFSSLKTADTRHKSTVYSFAGLSQNLKEIDKEIPSEFNGSIIADTKISFSPKEIIDLKNDFEIVENIEYNYKRALENTIISDVNISLNDDKPFSV